MQTASVFIITGKQGSGKTTRLKETVRELRFTFPGIFGFYARGEWDNGLRSVFHLVDIQTENESVLCYRKGRTDTSNGTFVFRQAALEFGKQIILSGIKNHGYPAVMDEIGRFELKGEVWHDLLRMIINREIPLLITVRENLLNDVISYFNIRHPVIFRPDDSGITAAILKALTEA